MRQKKDVKIIILGLVLLAVLFAAGCGSPAAKPEGPAEDAASSEAPEGEEASSPKKIESIAIALAGPRDDGAWNEAGYTALMNMEALGYEVGYVEGAYDPIRALPAMRKFAQEGYDLIVGHGFQAFEAGYELAREFPNQFFILHGGYYEDDSPPNLAIIDVRSDHTGYVEGVLAALMTKTNKAGFVSGLELGELARNAYGYELGLKSVNPDIELTKIYTGDFHDSQGAREAVFSMVDDGVDIVNAVGNGVSYGTITAAEEKGIWATGNTWDIRQFAPTRALVTGLFVWDPMWRIVIEDFENGVVPSEIYWATLTNGGHEMTEISDQVPEDIRAKVEAVKQQIISGEIEIPMWEP